MSSDNRTRSPHRRPSTPLESFKMNDKEAEYYASEFTDAQIDTMADAGDFYLEESGFCLMPTKAEIEKMMVEGEGYLWLKEVRPMWPFQ